ncbi:hypothetical protein [Maricaulis sp.]|uniref:hypothetical protein n=1 Tax=Maricaulis sp. TaxID=1486257 RepID=UPI0026267AD4|nr:hypothetical protein [Maricaulis sp.]MDF1769480.1 hypothetical protein [Maricaulis sp.]
MNRREFTFASIAALGLGGASSSALAQGQATWNQLVQSGALPDFIDPALFGNTEFDVTLGRGTMSLARSLSEIYAATGNRELAEQLRLSSQALVGDYDNDAFEATQNAIGEHSDLDIATMQIEANEEAAQHMSRATLFSGLGVAYNAIAIDQGAEFAQDTGNSLRGGGLGALRGGIGAVRNRRVIRLARAATEAVPGNLNLARNIYSATREYMQANDLEAPNQSDVDDALANWEY